MARGDDLILKISADTSAVASGLAPMNDALDTLDTNAHEASDQLSKLDKMNVSPTVDVDIRDEAIAKARQDIERLRDDVAHGVEMGLDTRAAQREISSLQSAIKKLTSEPETVEIDVDVDKEAMADALDGIDSLREGALGLGEAVGSLDGTMTGFANVAREVVPALADLNQTMVAMKLRNEAAGVSFGRLGRTVSSVTSVMAGPWGLAIAAGVGLLSGWAASQDSATDATDDFSDSIDYQTGALDKNNRTVIAKGLADKHMLETAEALGISTEDMVSALAGQKDAYDRVTDAIGQKMLRTEADKNLGDDYKESVDEFGHAFFGMTVKMFNARDESGQLARAVGEVAKSADGARFTLADMSTGLSHNADLWADYGKEVDESRKALDGIVSSLDILNGRFATGREATIAYEESLDNATAAIKENGKAVTKHGDAFDTNSEKGRNNEKALIDLAKASESMAEARLRDADSSGESTSKILADYEKQRTSLYNTARRMGLNEDAANDYVDSLLATPEELKTQVGLTGYDKAKNDMKDLTKERTAIVKVELQIDKFNRLPKRIQDAISGNGTVDIGLNAAPVAPATANPTVFMQPRIFLDSRPIRAALRGDVQSEVRSTVGATRQRGRL